MNWEEAAEKVFRGDTKLTEAAVILVESMNPAEIRRWAVFGAEERLTSLVRNKENVQRERLRRDQQKAVEKANLEYHQRLAQERADREAEERLRKEEEAKSKEQRDAEYFEKERTRWEEERSVRNAVYLELGLPGEQEYPTDEVLLSLPVYTEKEVHSKIKEMGFRHLYQMTDEVWGRVFSLQSRAALTRAFKAYEDEVRIKVTKELLTSTFALPDGTRVFWGEATVDQHLTVIKMLEKNAEGNLKNAGMHRDAIRQIEEAGVRTLAEAA